MSMGMGMFLMWYNNQGGGPVANINPDPTQPPNYEYDSEQYTPEHYEPDTNDETVPPDEDIPPDEPPTQEPDPPPADLPYGVVRSERFPFPGNTITRYSTNAADIMFLQNTLNMIRRNYTSIRSIDTATGSFGGVTRGAVVDFQLREGLPTTGNVDEITWYRIVYVLENPPDEPDPPFTPPVDVGYRTLVNLHLRDGPYADAYSLGIKPVGTLVWVMSYIPADRWFFVTLEDGLAGYMKVEFLIKDGLLQ